VKTNLSQYLTNNPKKFFELIPDCLHHVISVLLDYSTTPGYVTRGLEISNITIAGTYCTPQTVSKQISLLRTLGLIETIRRPHTSNITFLTDWWRNPKVQKILPLFFKRFPKLKPRVFKVALLLSMLFSSVLVAKENKLTYFQNLKTGTAIKNGINRSGGQRRGRELEPMKQKIEKILGIRSALLKRGETEVIDPYKLLAFSDACLDECIASMKFSTPKHPYRYFLSRAFEYSKQNNIEPDWITADTMRNKRIDAFEAKPERPAVVTPYVKKEVAEEPRKSNAQIIEETKERQKREQARVDEQEAARRKEREGTKLNLEDPFTQWFIKHLISELQKVDFESEAGKSYREQLAVFGILLPSVKKAEQV
jgi:hypothetical protein